MGEVIRYFTISITRRRIQKVLEEPDRKVVTGSYVAIRTMDGESGARIKWWMDCNVLKDTLEVVRMMALL